MALTQHGLHYAITVAMLATVGGAFITYAVEKDASGSNIHTIGDALWWAVTTVATVGYGDRYPVTPEGRGVALVLMFIDRHVALPASASSGSWSFSNVLSSAVNLAVPPSGSSSRLDGRRTGSDGCS